MKKKKILIQQHVNDYTQKCLAVQKKKQKNYMKKKQKN